MPEIGLAEALIIGLILFVIFGPNRMADIGGALGRSIRGFRTEVNADGANATKVPPIAQPLTAGETSRCGRCGGQLRESDKFCAGCGTAVSGGALTPER